MNKLKISLRTLLFAHNQNESTATVIVKDREYVDRVLNTPLSAEHFDFLKNNIKYVGVTENFREIIDYFKIPAGETPAGFKIQYELTENNG